MSTNGGYTPTTAAPASTAPSNPFGAAGFDVFTGGSATGTTSTVGGATVFHDTAPMPVKQNAATYLQQQLEGMSKPELKDFQLKLIKAGYLPKGSDTGMLDGNTVQAYQQLIGDVHLSNESGDTLSPEQYLDQKAGAANKPGGSNGPHTSTSVDLSSPENARSIAFQTFASSLGRKPKQAEMNAFYAALTQYEQSHPQTTTTTDNAAGTASTSTTSGGASPTDFAQQYVDQNYGAQEGAHDSLHFYDVLANALTGPPSGIQEVH